MKQHPLDILNYFETALWSSTDENGTPFNGQYTIDDVAPEALAQARADLDGFYMLLSEETRAAYTLDQLAHDFWLTRNRHGAGFWDGDYPKAMADELTKWAHSYGSQDLYVGDDGRVYIA